MFCFFHYTNRTPICAKWLTFNGKYSIINSPINKNLTEECDCMKNVKKIVILMTPILLFAILFVPYDLVNQHFIVDWLGCGCPVIDEAGNVVENNFNANDFTALFWLFVSACVTAISAFLAKRIPKEKVWLRVLYIAGMIVISLLITYQFCQMMRWS